MKGISYEQIIDMIKNGTNPQALAMSLLEGNLKANPALANLLSFVKQGNTDSVEAFARNYFQSMGRDFDKEFKDFRNKTGL